MNPQDWCWHVVTPCIILARNNSVVIAGGGGGGGGLEIERVLVCCTISLQMVALFQETIEYVRGGGLKEFITVTGRMLGKGPCACPCPPPCLCPSESELLLSQDPATIVF